MSKRTRKPKKSQNKKNSGGRKPTVKTAAERADASRRKLVATSVKAFAAIFTIGAISVAGATAYRNHWQEVTDLSVIGNGSPTVVQVHDPSCKLCQALKANTTVALGDFDDSIQYRIVEINTPAGRAFSTEHNVRHVTLVTFTGSGRVVDKLQGVREPAELRPYFDRLVKRNLISKKAKQ